MQRFRLLVYSADSDLVALYERLRPERCDIDYLRDANDPDERRRRLARADVVLHSNTPLTGDDLSFATRLLLIQRQGVGFDGIDTAAAASAGIPVCLCPVGTPESVSEFAVLLMLAVGRHLPEIQEAVASGEWPKRRFRSTSIGLQDSNVLIVGFGAIGQAVASRLLPFGASVTAVLRPGRQLDDHWQDQGVSATTHLDEALPSADIVTLHCPLDDETRGFFSPDRIGKMKTDSILINTARGGLIDEKALLESLVEGHLLGVGLDVMEAEPPPPDHPFRNLPGIVLTPHLAAGLRTVQERKAAAVLENAEAVVDGRPPKFRLRHP